MDELEERLDELLDQHDDAEGIRAQLLTLASIYPFNRFEYVIAHLIAAGKLSIEDYRKLRADYVERNPYLPLFESGGPRGFGEGWAQAFLRSACPALVKPSKVLDPNFDGDYDLFLEPRIRVEVKASRAVASNERGALYLRALSSTSDKPLVMNFQQIKPRCCDVLIWLAVWRDVVRCWVIASAEVEANQYYSQGQHRGNTGEGQLHLTRENITSFVRYVTPMEQLEHAVREAFAREQQLRHV